MQDVARCREADAFADVQRGAVAVIVFRVEHEAAFATDGAAEEDVRVFRCAIAIDAELVEQFGEIVLVARLVEHDAHRVFFVVGADEDDRPAEAGVFDRGGRDRQLACKRAFQTVRLQVSQAVHAGLSGRARQAGVRN